MKKILNISIILAALALTSSCNRDEGRLEPEQDRAVTITAAPAQTKTVLDGGAVKWEDGDQISLVFTHDTEAPVVRNFSTSIEGENAAGADFAGTLPVEVYREGSGYHETVRAVYPHDAVSSEGVMSFTLPIEQNARTNGAFAPGLNLASAVVSLADIQDDGNASATFRNALSILRFAVDGDDVTSVTLTGTAPLAGKAPFVYSESDGRLVVDTDAEWSVGDKQMSVTLRPADGSECFAAATEYNLLVLPGSHTELTAVVNFKEYGDYQKSKTFDVPFDLEPAKFYGLDFNVDSETLVKEITDPLAEIEAQLDDLQSRIEALETAAEKIETLVDQIQSVALISDYLDNSVYASYAKGMYGGTKMPVEVNYLVRPAKAMELLLQVCGDAGNLSDVISGQLSDLKGNLTKMTVTEAALEGDILSVTLDPAPLWDGFYQGQDPAAVALQISDGNTDMLSDFAKLVPMSGAVLNIPMTDNIPVLKGASFTMAFNYGSYDFSKCQATVDAVGFASTPTVSIGNGKGYVYAHFREDDDLSAMSITVNLTCEGESSSKTLTFADGGSFEVETSGDVDCIGGEVSLKVTRNDFGSYSLTLNGGGDWMTSVYTGVSGLYSVKANEGAERTATAVYHISNGDVSYNKSYVLRQKASGTAIDESRYYMDNEYLLLDDATGGTTPLNIVILGDGYQQKDLQKGGKFERSARSAMDAFFGVAPFSDFRDRFNVYMVAHKSVDEGPGLGSAHDTYFKTWWQGGTNTYVNYADPQPLKDVLRNTLGFDDKAYYRTVVILLVNTDENIGSTNYLSQTTGDVSVTGDGYATCSVAMVSAGTTGMGGLVRHEAGGHGFGRLGDEYADYSVQTVNDKHAVGFYRNIATNTSAWSDFTAAGYGSDKVTYDKQYTDGVYRSTHESGIMWDNNGGFNAVSRHLIYERIIKQNEGQSAYSWANFLEYDKKNL